MAIIVTPAQAGVQSGFSVVIATSGARGRPALHIRTETFEFARRRGQNERGRTGRISMLEPEDLQERHKLSESQAAMFLVMAAALALAVVLVTSSV